MAYSERLSAPVLLGLLLLACIATLATAHKRFETKWTDEQRASFDESNSAPGPRRRHLIMSPGQSPSRELMQRKHRQTLETMHAARSRFLLTATPNDLIFMLSSNVWMGPFYTVLELGTPPVAFPVLVDTSVAVTWVFCDCLSCPEEEVLFVNRTRFLTAKSSTASPVNCSSPTCASSHAFTCNALDSVRDRPDVCEFNGTFAAGDVYNDVLSVALVSSTAAAAPQPPPARVSSPFNFGCARVNATDAFVQFEADGTLAIGYGNMTLATQLAAPARPNAMALCLDGTNSEGVLMVGNTPDPLGLFTTSFDHAPNSSRYLINVTGMRVGGATVKGSASVSRMLNATHGGFCLDTARDYLGLRDKVYQAMEDMVFSNASKGGNELIQHASGLTCAQLPNTTSWDFFPSVFFDLPEGAIEVTPRNYLFVDTISVGDGIDLYCLLASPIPDFAPRNAYMGTPWLLDQYLKFDMDNKKLAMRAFNCTAWDSLEYSMPGAAAPSPPPPPSPHSHPSMPHRHQHQARASLC